MGQVIAKPSGPSLPDLPTVTAIALVAYAASNVLHEAVGHGGACLALGGKPLVLSSVHFECGEQAMSALALRGVAAAGTIVNFIVGVLALVVLKTANPLRRPHAAYFLWLFTTLNLLSGAGYFLFSGVGGIGDWADVARGAMPPLVWRPVMSVFGGALYFLLARQSAQWLRSLAGSDELSIKMNSPSRRISQAVFSLPSPGLFNPVGPILIAISAAAASFGGASRILMEGSESTTLNHGGGRGMGKQCATYGDFSTRIRRFSGQVALCASRCRGLVFLVQRSGRPEC